MNANRPPENNTPPPENLDGKQEVSQGSPDNKNALHERQKAVLEARNKAHNLAHQLEIEHHSEGTLSDLVFSRGPDTSGPHKEKNKTDSAFGKPLDTEYSHFGEKVLSRWNNVGMLEPSTLSVLGASLVLATTGVIVDVARHVPGDIFALAFHPVRVYKETKAIWDDGMERQETSIS